ncbi:MAG TPA: enolase C-terminal domain-like protein [Streptosporangiaceae bacterium]|nr:enolase C-terminal domain-like protein [Streptosporangiaceae bacterium]
MTDPPAATRRPVKIATVAAIPVAVPLRSPLRSALGVQSRSEYGIVIVETECGVRGLGEISMIWHGNGAGLCDVVNHLLGPGLIGADPFGITGFHALAAERLAFGKHSQAAVAAVETALLDIQGRLLGVPVFDLLGGLARERVPLSMSLSIAPAADMVRQAGEFHSAGFTTVKVKDAGGGQVAGVVRDLRSEFGAELGIRVDLNMACTSAKDALRLIRRLLPYDVLSVEQPLPAGDLDGMAYLRTHSEIPIMADESVWTQADAWQVLRAGAADIVNVYVPEAGGPTRARNIIEMCAVAGTGVAIGSMPELGIGTAAAAHVAFSAARLDQPSDVAGHLYHVTDVATTCLRIEAGQLLPPDCVGLGAELDEDRLAALRLDQ